MSPYYINIMFLATKSIGKFGVGLGIGLGFGWFSDNEGITIIQHFSGMDVTLSSDYLKISDSSLDLKAKRELFTQKLNEKGASPRLVFLIGDYNRKAFEYKAENGYTTLTRREQLELLEEEFKKYYPELLDSETDKEFISSLNLKLYCNDHYNVPDNLRAMK